MFDCWLPLCRANISMRLLTACFVAAVVAVGGSWVCGGCQWHHTVPALGGLSELNPWKRLDIAMCSTSTVLFLVLLTRRRLKLSSRHSMGEIRGGQHITLSMLLRD
ncbi:hypothetical protein QBC40DRAFT_275057 [Triangularia verruculosa]|uniref:Uncharacterized protein n=1 Tax=Triangularia verruculosa TaxID=2587418 RepID=A0AAN7AZW1_9PEZI|nr:hypothetical protein QBC40DRAFT_275057 [Triangularia verruculosa]